ncbi:ComEC family competence protein [Gramella sp. YB25]|uniref:ComEC family competence protein n=2 Tax=Christiangramia crocea TaxID=2904124 RepID=A0A9X1UWV5_9FLAO|nr:ComEC family competence protein [Gramella crocea]
MLFFLIAYLNATRQLFPSPWMGVATFFLIFSIGLFSTYYSIPENQANHYLQKDSGTEKIFFAKAIITEELKPTQFSERYLLKVEELISETEIHSSRGKLLLNVNSDSINLQPGNKILIPWTPQEIKPPLNPFQFNYKDYMKRLGVERQVSISGEQLEVTGQEENFIVLAWTLREKLISNLRNYDFGKEELAVFQALILGQRRDIDDQLYKNYAAAGAIHILAISGLHIGILMLLLNFLLKPVEKLKYGKYLKPGLVIILLWGFAILSGLSPSVVRAVCMFSFIAIGLQLKRKTSTLNSLFLSLFFLLLINPFYLFQVGFQMSYLAVFSIIVFQPYINRLFSPKIRIIDYFWKIISVSLAAQIGVLPLSLYYFHQFPGLFLVSSLVVLPLLGFILALGILVILLAFMNILPQILADLLGMVITFLNTFIGKIAKFDVFVFSDIDFSLLQSMAVYLILLGILLVIAKPNFKRLCFLLISIMGFQLASFYNKINNPADEIVVFHRTRESVIGKKQKYDLTIFAENKDQLSFLKAYLRERQIENFSLQQLPDILSVSDQICLVIDTTASYNLKEFQPEFIILRNSPRLNMERLINQLQPRQIIADGSNHPSFVNQWRNTCRLKKIPFHYTGEKGAYIFP